MSEMGRSRFGPFPPVIADDAYARAHFAADEIEIVGSARSIVRAPRRSRDLIKIGTRSRLGDLELRAKYPVLWADKKSTKDSLAVKAMRVPLSVWPLFPAYAALKMVIRLRARRLVRDLETYDWDRDESNR
jgi:hypothetical protein